MSPEQQTKIRSILKATSLNEVVRDIQVIYPGMWENDLSPILGHWFAVTNHEGIIAYFGDEHDADVFRSAYIEQICEIYLNLY